MHPRQSFVAAPFVAALFFLHCAAHAEEASDKAPPPGTDAQRESVVANALPTVTVTATLSEHDTRTAPASVTVITAEELAARNASDLLDAVRGAPGITFTPRQVGGRKTIALRGLEGKHTLTLIDGRRISASDDVIGHSDYQYGWLPMSAIERVEIIRGPMSALYGSEALGGVINLITRRPRDHWVGSLGFSGTVPLDADSASREARGSVYAAGPLGDKARLSIQAEGSYRGMAALPTDGRLSEIEGRRPRTLGVNGEWDVARGQLVEAGIMDGKESRFSDEVNMRRIPYHNRYDIDRSQGHVGWRGQFDNWNGQLRAYRSEMKVRNFRTNNIAPTRPQDLRDTVVDGHATMKLDSHLLTAGGEWRDEELVNAGLKGGRDDATHKALFLQDEIALGARWTATLGLRADHHEMFGSHASPRAYLAWEANPDLVIKGGYGRAFKAPTLKQISPNYVGAEGPHTFHGNGDLQPETSASFELSAHWQPVSALQLNATLFHTDVKQLITYRLLKAEGMRRTYVYDNVDQARVRGLETGFAWDVTPALRWSTDAQFLSTRDKATGKQLNDRPRTSFTSRVSWRVHQWSAQLEGEYTGRQTSYIERLPAYTLWNASLGRMWNLGDDRKFHLRAGLQNIGDLRLLQKSAAFGYAEQGRRIFVSGRMDF
ncbi:TonB-dependent receptor plug domain-containing protein [Diaphorobacter aerolatus]|uniref:TonB-dependent receptor n=1 Tax=Diaphorobacter aerolatus TaxID=1288495 RepID=A0A7H0GGE3_9BURK|nr:TonB-dependent receptor [Diaphorobacter aerolatus]QNP47359.1 TonB-dependent receptor [Diaphorobacter aerolatus]